MIFQRDLGLGGVIDECGGGRNEGRPMPRWWRRLRPVVAANISLFPEKVSIPFLGAWIEQETDGRHDRVSSMGEVGLFQLHLDEIGALIGHRTDNIDKSSRPWKPIGPVADVVPQVTSSPTASVQWGARLLTYYDRLLQRDAGPIERGTHLWHGLLKAMHWAPQARFWVPHVRNALGGNLPRGYDDFAVVMHDIWEGRLPYAQNLRRPTRPIECAPIWVLQRTPKFVTQADATALNLLTPTFAEGLLAALVQPAPQRRRPPSFIPSLLNPTGLGTPPPVGVRFNACTSCGPQLGSCIPIDWWRSQVQNERPQGVGFGAAAERGVLADFAQVIPRPKTQLSWRKRPIWGLALHTTGSEPLMRAERRGTTALDEAINIYREQPGPTYLIDWTGRIWAITPDERLKTHHTRITPAQAQQMRTGAWTLGVHDATLQHWARRWGTHAASPLDLFPGDDPKEVYVGVEMLPVRVGSFHPGPPAMAPGLKFTKAQHDAVVRLAQDVAGRHALPKRWERTSRLVGHEDLNPADRNDAGGGWDPGALRADPYFDLAYVRDAIGRRPLVWIAVGMAALTGVAGALWYRHTQRR